MSEFKDWDASIEHGHLEKDDEGKYFKANSEERGSFKDQAKSLFSKDIKEQDVENMLESFRNFMMSPPVILSMLLLLIIIALTCQTNSL